MAPQLEAKTQKKSKLEDRYIRAFPAGFPRELLDEILFLYLSTKAKTDLPKIYKKLRKKSRVCRKAFGDQESANLFNDQDIDAYICLSKSFDKVFHHTIHFGSLYCLEIRFPTTFTLCSMLGDSLSTSGVIHLNIHCGHSLGFVQDLQTPSWRAALQRLQIFRIKYIVSVKKNGDNLYPWNHPLWIDLLSSCTSLQMFLLKTPLPVDDSDNMLIDRWTRNLHCLQKAYLFHGYDEAADVGDHLWIGSNNLYRRNGLASSGSAPSSAWYSIHIRPKDFGRGLLSSGIRWMPMLDEDFDVYGSDISIYDSDVSDSDSDSDVESSE